MTRERNADLGRRTIVKAAVAVPVATAAAMALDNQRAEADPAPGTFDLDANYVNTYDISAHGADKNDSTATWNAFNECLGLAATNGGVVYVPPGTWTVNKAIVMDSGGVTLLGAGWTASKIVMDPVVNNQAGLDHLVKMIASTTAVERISLQNHPPSTLEGTHAILLDPPNVPNPPGPDLPGTLRWVRIRDVRILGASSYGIGLQGGSFQDIWIENVNIANVGTDGIDWKDLDPNNHNDRNFVRNVVVSNWGLRGTDEDDGIDVRGRITLQNIELFGSGGVYGVKFRTDSGTDGGGADYSTLENYYITLPTVGRGVYKEAPIPVAYTYNGHNMGNVVGS